MEIKTKKGPLFTLLKRDQMPQWLAILIRVGIVLGAFILCVLFSAIFIKDNPFVIFVKMFTGAFNMPMRLLLDTALLLGFGVAIVPSFKMKYWNMGANGCVLVGCLAACVCMFYLGKDTKMSTFPMLIIMFFASVIAATIWSIIPAIFKVFFNTNETLFTLMMNYIAIFLTSYVNFLMTKGKQDNTGVINLLLGRRGWMPHLFGQQYLIPIIVIAVIVVFIYFYVNKTKEGFEITVLGDSPRTAQYATMNIKWITIRTLLVCGIICGIFGFLYASAIDHSVSGSTGGLGFTGVLVAWLSNFNPIIMAVVSFMLTFITAGCNKISSGYRLGNNNLGNLIIGVVFFAVLISEFILRYRVKFNFLQKKEKVEEAE